MKVFVVREESPKKSGFKIARRFLVVERVLEPQHKFVDVDVGERRAYLFRHERAYPDVLASDVFSIVLDEHGRWWFNLWPGSATRLGVPVVCFEPYGWGSTQARAHNHAMLESMLKYAPDPTAPPAVPLDDEEALVLAVQLLSRERIARLVMGRRLRSGNPTLESLRAAAAVAAA